MALSHITSQQRHDFFVALSFVSGSLRRLPSSLGWRAELKQQNWSYFGVIFFGKKSPTHRDVHGWSVSMFFFFNSHKHMHWLYKLPSSWLVWKTCAEKNPQHALRLNWVWAVLKSGFVDISLSMFGVLHYYDAGMVRFLWCLIFRVSELLDDFELILLLFFWWFLIIFLLTVLE